MEFYLGIHEYQDHRWEKLAHITSFPGLPGLQFLITCSMLWQSKVGGGGRPRNEGTIYTVLVLKSAGMM